MPRGVEFKQAGADVLPGEFRLQLGRPGFSPRAEAGQHPRQRLHIELAVATVHAQGVQLQQLAGVVFVRAAGAVLVVVQITLHRRMAGHRAQQLAEIAQRIGAQRGFFVIGQQHPHIALVLVDIEVVEPEPAHLLQQLLLAVELAQQLPMPGLAGRQVQRRLIRLARQLAFVLGRRLVLIPPQLIGGLGQFDDGPMLNAQRVDLCLRGRRQGPQRGRIGQQLLFDISSPAFLRGLIDLRLRRAPADAVDRAKQAGAFLKDGRCCGRGGAGRHQRNRRGKCQQQVAAVDREMAGHVAGGCTPHTGLSTTFAFVNHGAGLRSPLAQ